MSAVRFEPTEADLRHAWQHCKRSARTPWPPTFEEAMADDTLSRIVRITAMHPPKAHRKPEATARSARPAQRTPSTPTGLAPGHFDRKRAAAGDRDD